MTGLPEDDDPHVRFLIRDAWMGGFIAGWFWASVLVVVALVVVAVHG